MSYETIVGSLMQSSYVWAAFWLVFAFIIAKIVSFILKRFAATAAHKSRLTLYDRLFPAIRRPIMYLIILAGVYMAVANVPVLSNYRWIVVPAISIVELAFIALLVFRTGDAVLIWYTERRNTRNEAVYTEVLPTVEKVWKALVVIVALVLALGQAGIEIGPLVTSLGIAGLAVALAFQDILANFFSGIYLTTNRPIKKGQYIKLDSGQEGYVETIDWRNTKLKSPGGQMVIVPNVKVSQAIITNYHEPIKKYPFLITFLVRPDSDFTKLEDIVIKTANETIKTTPGVDAKYPPLFRISEINEYGVKAGVLIQVDEYSNQYLIKHEIQKELLKKFKKEGIELTFMPDSFRKR